MEKSSFSNISILTEVASTQNVLATSVLNPHFLKSIQIKNCDLFVQLSNLNCILQAVYYNRGIIVIQSARLVEPSAYTRNITMCIAVVNYGIQSIVPETVLRFFASNSIPAHLHRHRFQIKSKSFGILCSQCGYGCND